METDPSNEVYFNQLKKAWNLTSGPIPSEERVEHELGNYMEYIRSKHRKYSTGLLLKYAAIVMIPLLSVIYWLQLEKDEIPSQMAVGNPGIIPGEHKAMLITAQGQTIALLPSQERDICVQEDFVVKNGQAGIVYQDSKKAVSTLQYNTLKTPRGGEYTVVLSDGTKVYLNAASELKYPVQFDSKKRQVHLSGEAYFEVVRDTNRPFYVVTDAVRVKVYGTEFNVNTYGVGGTQTTLVSGKVGIRGKSSGREYMMEPLQLAEFDVNGEFKGIRNVNAGTYTAWKEGFFVFENEGLEDILNRLSRWYDVEFRFKDEKLKEFQFTGTVNRDEGLDGILNLMERMNVVSFEKRNGYIWVKENDKVKAYN